MEKLSTHPSSLKSRMKQLAAANSFVLGMGAAILLAAIAPEIGSKESPLPVDGLKTIGIFLIFFFQGACLPLDELQRGLANWRLHLCVQSTTFLFFPMVTAGGLWLVGDFFPSSELRQGFLYLSFLPTTIASAIALTASSGGNVSGALFNTTVSNVGGVFLVPVLCLAFLEIRASGSSPAIAPVLADISLMILLPLFIGQCLRWILRDRIGRHRTAIRRFNNGVILFIVYAAFCDSFAEKVWSGIELSLLWKTMGGVSALLGVASVYAWLLSGWIRLDRKSRVTALLCGSQKTLAVGLPLAVMIFGGESSSEELGLIILPLLMYHPLQLILGGWLTPRLAKYVGE